MVQFLQSVPVSQSIDILIFQIWLVKPFETPYVYFRGLCNIYILLYIDLFLSQTSRDCTCQGDHQKVLESQCAELRKLWRPDGKGGICSLIDEVMNTRNGFRGRHGQTIFRSQICSETKCECITAILPICVHCTATDGIMEKRYNLQAPPVYHGKNICCSIIMFFPFSIILSAGTRPQIRSLNAF